MADKGLFFPYKKRIFIETGTQTGSGVECALSSGFEEVYSIELNKEFHDRAVEAFKDNPHVHLYLGDSRVVLPEIMKEIKEPATIWLDAHDSKDSPILEELDTISKHPIKSHTILIDDCKNFGPHYQHMGFFEVAKRLQQINLNYRLQLVTANAAYPQNVLVAEVD